MSPGWVTGLSQGKSSGGTAILMPLDWHAFLLGCPPLVDGTQFGGGCSSATPILGATLFRCFRYFCIRQQ
jgi:hypothetical protein